MRNFGLIGENLNHSFSASYFKEKFIKENIHNAKYKNFEINNISEFHKILKKENLAGLNITIPYKESILPFLDELSEDAKNIGAVNTIEFKDSKLIGHNTDIIGFKKSIQPILKGRNSALILGSGGASKAIKLALNQLNISSKIVSRNSSFDYIDITPQNIGKYSIIINTTPLGMFPKSNTLPNIPYQELSNKNLLFDLNYNPAETLFLKFGRKQKTITKNGLEMLHIQANSSWEIWNT